jgi:hypothetical protein
MSSTPPPDDSSYRFSLTPLPAPPRRQTPEIVQSLTDDFDDPTVPVEEQRGFSWLANYPRDPLRYAQLISTPSFMTAHLRPQSIVFLL